MTEALTETRTALRGRTNIAVVEPDDTIRDVLMAHVTGLEGRATAYRDLDEFRHAVDPADIVVVVIGPSRPPEELVPEAEELLLVRPTVGIVMVVMELVPEILQLALRAGVDDVVAVTDEDKEFTDAISRAETRLLSRVPAAPPTAQRPPVQEPPHVEGRVISVFCTKGGVGKSVIAVNLAVALARMSSRPVVLVDADMQFGDVALMLQLHPRHTIAEAVAAGDRLDGALVESIMLTHEPSGLRVLAAPTEPGPADHIKKDDLARVLAVLREQCSYVVVDTSANFGEITLAAVKGADEILLVAGLDVMSLKSAKVGLETMRVLGVPYSKISFVLNRANTNVGLASGDAEKALMLKVDVALPSDVVVAASVNTGTPVVMGSPKSKFARGIVELADQLARPTRSPSRV
jgi:pilus assembly protein CpaE